jgi:hypothetical protein
LPTAEVAASIVAQGINAEKIASAAQATEMMLWRDTDIPGFTGAGVPMVTGEEVGIATFAAPSLAPHLGQNAAPLAIWAPHFGQNIVIPFESS